jgi:hypothetical protein
MSRGSRSPGALYFLIDHAHRNPKAITDRDRILGLLDPDPHAELRFHHLNTFGRIVNHRTGPALAEGIRSTIEIGVNLGFEKRFHCHKIHPLTFVSTPPA